MAKKSHCILVVDDDPDIREGVSTVLTDDGYTVATAANGREALELLRKWETKPCLILLDFLMPEMSGPELVAAMQHCHRLMSIPVVIVAGIHGALVPGAQKFIRKPISYELLAETVKEYCNPKYKENPDECPDECPS
jgi:CheY-like chemotaxis protein